MVFDVNDTRLLTSIDVDVPPYSNLSRPRGHVAFSPDSQWLATDAAIWDIASGRKIAILGAEPFSRVAFSPDGRCIATIRAGELQVCTIKRSAAIGVAWRRPNPLAEIAFSPDGAQLVVDRDILGAASGRHIASLDGPEGVMCACFSPKGDQLAMAYGDNTLRLWDISRRQQLACAVVGSSVSHLAFSADARRIFSAGKVGKRIQVWTADLTVAGARAVAVPSWESLAFSADGQRVAVVPGREVVQVYRLVEEAERPGQLAEHSGKVLWLRFLDGGGRLLLVSHGGVQIWNTATAEPETHYPLERGVTEDQFALSADGRFLAYRTGTTDEEQDMLIMAMLNGMTVDVDTFANKILKGPEIVGIDLSSGEECPVSLHGKPLNPSRVMFPNGQEAPLVGKAELTGAVAPVSPQWQMQSLGSETVIQAVETGRAVAWFPASLEELTPHSSGRTWAGAEGNDVYFLTLEEAP